MVARAVAGGGGLGNCLIGKEFQFYQMIVSWIDISDGSLTM